MLLAIDAGNTNTVFAVIEGDTVRQSWRLSTDSKRTADEYAVWLTQLMGLQGIDPASIDGAIIATVVPEALFNLKSLCRRYFRQDPLVVGEPGVDLGIRATIDNPAEVGADRLVTGLAAFHKYGGPILIVDFGTATTFDLVDAQGNFAGGIISPGLNLSLQALYMAAAKLPRVGIRQTETVIGRNTVAAMQSGTFWGYVGLVEGLVRRIRAEFGATDTKPLPVVATGGLAPMFQGATDCIDHVEDDLIMHGLVLIYRRNKG